MLKIENEQGFLDLLSDITFDLYDELHPENSDVKDLEVVIENYDNLDNDIKSYIDTEYLYECDDVSIVVRTEPDEDAEYYVYDANICNDSSTLAEGVEQSSTVTIIYARAV